MKFQRTIPSESVRDKGSIVAIEYNEASGAQKVVAVGPHLIPLAQTATAGVLNYTTDATAATNVGMGACLAIYNNSGTVGTITMGDDSSVAVLTPGTTSILGSVGIPCAPNSYTYLSLGTQSWIIASAATLLVFKIDDPTRIKIESVI